MNTKVLVTGSNGFIGSQLVARLIKEGLSVKCMLRPNSDTRWLEGLEYEICYADFRDVSQLESAIIDVSKIYHLGGAVRAVHNKTLYATNSLGTQNLVKAVQKMNPDLENFIYVSSQAAWGPDGCDAVSDYGKSKAIGEEYVRALEHYSIVRPVAVYGPRDKDFLPVFKMAQRGLFIKPANIKTKLSFVYVEDCIEGIINAVDKTEIFLSDGMQYSWDDFAQYLGEAFDRKINIMPVPVNLVKSLAWFGTVIPKCTGKAMSLNSDKAKEIFAGDWVVPSTALTRSCKLGEGLKKTLQWYKINGWM